ncbi:STAS domain-containing protein [Streptomyces sp. NPDC051452]|uniref:STAS domain-containing protein n=1 Tax=Streptomyces sp. NPDC051452 TaxID=3365654 RepID=UPI0037A508DD
MTHTHEPAESARLTVTHGMVGEVDVVTVCGEIDHDCAGQLLEALTADTADAGGSRTVVDLSGVTFIDSSGINALITAHRTAEGGLSLARPTASVLRVIELVGLDTVMGCYSTLDEALAA